MGHDDARIDVPALDVAQQVRQIPVHVRLTRAQREALLHEGIERRGADVPGPLLGIKR